MTDMAVYGVPRDFQERVEEAQRLAKAAFPGMDERRSQIEIWTHAAALNVVFLDGRTDLVMPINRESPSDAIEALIDALKERLQ